MANTTDIARHPDIVALRERYEMASARPIAGVVEGLTFLAALYLAASPWIVGFRGLTEITVANLIAGGGLVFLALALSASYGRLHGVTWVVPALGAWTMVAPWAMAGVMDTTRTIWSNELAGGSIVVLGLLMMLIGARRYSDR